MVLRVLRTLDSEVLQHCECLPPPSPNLTKLVLSQREKKCCLSPAPPSLRRGPGCRVLVPTSSGSRIRLGCHLLIAWGLEGSSSVWHLLV